MALSERQCQRIKLGAIGRHCLIHETVQFFNASKVFLGDNVRIDCFSILSAGPNGLYIGNHVHLGAGCYLFGGGGKILLEDFSGLSSRVSLFTASDEFTDGCLFGACIPERYRKVTKGDVTLRINAGVGAGSVVLPGVTIGFNARVGALTVVGKDVPDHELIAGNSPRRVRRRPATLYRELIDRFQKEQQPDDQ
jgi:galactoside O-acetyltransferase